MITTLKNNKTLLWVSLMVVAMLVFTGWNMALARFTGDTFDMIVEDAQAIDNQQAHLLLADLTEATSTVLVDLSDITNFPHFRNAGAIEVSQIRVTWEVADSSFSLATTTAKFGVYASTTDAGEVADIYWFDTVTFSAETENRKTVVLDYSPSLMRLGLSSGVPTDFVTGDISTSTTNYATTTNLISPAVAFTSTTFPTNPGVGDLVMDVSSHAGTASIGISVLYHINGQ